MTILPDTAQPPAEHALTEAATKALASIQAHTDGLGQIAAFLRANPDLPNTKDLLVGNSGAVSVYIVSRDHAKEIITYWMGRAIDAGALVEPYDNQAFGGVSLYFGAARIQVYTVAEWVSEQVVVTKETSRLAIEIPEHARREQPAGGAL